MTKKSLHDTHQHQLSNHINNVNNTLQIVTILGGIDNILSNYLSESNNLLSPNDNDTLIEISQILNQNTSTNKQKIISKELTTIMSASTVINTQDPNNQMDTSDNYYLEFSESNTYLHALFNVETANKMLTIFHAKILRIIFFLSVLIYMYLLLARTFYTIIFPTISLIICCIFWIPYGTFWLLSANKRAMKQIIRSFEFWFKVIYALIWAILLAIYFYAFSSLNYPIFRVIQNLVVFGVATVLFVICVSSFDALNIHQIWKIAISVIMATLFTIASVFFQFVFPVHGSVVSIAFFGDISLDFSLSSLISSSARILAIFSLKQAIGTYRGKGKCVLIKKHPYVQWINPDLSLKHNDSMNEKDNSMATIEMQDYDDDDQ